MLSLDQFTATKTEYQDLGPIIEDECVEGHPGLVYLGCLYIELEEGGNYSLLIGRDVWVSSDLSALEEKLYDFAVSEGYCDEDVKASG